jgi:predicted metal-dependent hydrolase
VEKRHFEYKIIYSRRRSIAISVGPDSGVVVRAPYMASAKKIEALVSSKSAWIVKHLEKQTTFTRLKAKQYADGETILFHGSYYTLRLIPSGKNRIEVLDDTIQASIRTPSEPEKVKIIIDRWYRERAEEEFRLKLTEILGRFSEYNFSPSGFSVKSMRRRWGSCTARGKITLNSELIKLNGKFTEYVILHELCHLVHHNHGADYYRLLSEVFPAWKSVRKELRQYLG